MKTIDLKEGKPSVDELLMWAKSEAVMIHGVDGAYFVLEEADEFEQEVAALGRSENFMKFLEKRSKEKGRIPIGEVARRLGIKTS